MTSSTSGPHATAVDPPVVLVWLVWFLRCLTAAWLATAFLYGLSVGTLPEPTVGLVTAVVLAVLIATVLVATGLDRAGIVMLSPEPGSPASNSSAAGSYEPPTTRSSSRPSGAARPAPSLDLSAYSRAERGGRQCPRCGSFSVSTSEDGAQQVNTCRICSQVWRSGAGLPDPDVVVRSWLHR